MVHEEEGIGIFRGWEEMTVEGGKASVCEDRVWWRRSSLSSC